jgi:hypothetical protein
MAQSLVLGRVLRGNLFPLSGGGVQRGLAIEAPLVLGGRGGLDEVPRNDRDSCSFKYKVRSVGHGPTLWTVLPQRYRRNHYGAMRRDKVVLRRAERSCFIHILQLL